MIIGRLIDSIEDYDKVLQEHINSIGVCSEFHNILGDIESVDSIGNSYLLVGNSYSEVERHYYSFCVRDKRSILLHSSETGLFIQAIDLASQACAF